MWSDEDFEMLKENAFKVCQQYLEGPWQDITVSEFGFSQVRGGLSNRLYHCYLPEKRQLKDTDHGAFTNEVLLRIYGPVQEEIPAMIQEAVIFTLLSEKNLGPKLYGIFSDGRLEQYIPSKSFNSSDIKKYSTTIAKEMAKVHSLSLPINKHPNILTEQAQSWIQFLEENIDKNKFETSICQIIEKKELKKEMQWLNDIIEKKNWPVVFCHNDLQGGNILYPEDMTDENGEKSLILIDFEYGGYNYRGFDISNHFCEWCFDYNTKDFPFFEADVNKFPTRSEQLAFLEAYLNQIKELGKPFRHTSVEEEKFEILNEVCIFRLASHLVWSIWSLKFAMTSSINFGFEEYGKTRWDIYHQYKAEFLRNNLGNEDIISSSSVDLQ